MQIVMLHEPRRRRSWLIFDVGQKMFLLILVLLVGACLLGLGCYVAFWLWKKGPYARVAVVGTAAFLSFHTYVAVFPGESLYRDEFQFRTGIVMPPSAKIIFKKASYPDFHGDYASEMLFEVSKSDFGWLERALTLNPPTDDGAISGMYWREAEARYGKKMEPIGRGWIRKRDSDERGAWALLDDGRTVYFWFVQT